MSVVGILLFVAAGIAACVIAWYVLRHGSKVEGEPGVYRVFDTFVDEAAGEAHMSGPPGQEFAIQRGRRADCRIVNVHNKARVRVEQRIGRHILTLEEVGLALGNLSAEQQVIVIGRFLAGQKIEDLAQALGKQPGAVRILQFRALNTLAKHLGLVRGSRSKRKGERV